MSSSHGNSIPMLNVFVLRIAAVIAVGIDSDEISLVDGRCGSGVDVDVGIVTGGGEVLTGGGEAEGEDGAGVRGGDGG